MVTCVLLGVELRSILAKDSIDQSSEHKKK